RSDRDGCPIAETTSRPAWGSSTRHNRCVTVPASCGHTPAAPRLCTSLAIDTSDAPELLDCSSAKRGLFYRPVKQQLTLRRDAGCSRLVQEAHYARRGLSKHVTIRRRVSTYRRPAR